MKKATGYHGRAQIKPNRPSGVQYLIIKSSQNPKAYAAWGNYLIEVAASKAATLHNAGAALSAAPAQALAPRW